MYDKPTLVFKMWLPNCMINIFLFIFLEREQTEAYRIGVAPRELLRICEEAVD